MAIWYIDPEGGDPNANGNSYATRRARPYGLSINSGDEVRFMKSPDPSFVGNMYWTSAVSSHGGISNHGLSVSSCQFNGTAWLFYLSSSHYLSVGDYFYYHASNNAYAIGLFKVSTVVNSTTILTTSVNRNMNSTTNGGVIVPVNNKIAKFQSYSSPKVKAVDLCNTDNVTWNSYNNSSCFLTTGYQKNMGAFTQYVSIRNGGIQGWKNLLNPIVMGDLTCLNWWTLCPSSSSYIRYASTPQRNGYGSGQLQLRLYTSQNIGGQYVEFAFPYMANHYSSQFWIPCYANVYNPSGLDLNSTSFQSIAINVSGYYGQQDIVLSGIYLSEARPVQSWIANTTSNGSQSSCNLGALIAPNNTEDRWVPIEGCTPDGDIILGSPTFIYNSVAPYNYGNNTYSTRQTPWLRLKETNRLATENLLYGSYVRQTFRADGYTSAQDLYLSSVSNVTCRGGYDINSMTSYSNDDRTFINLSYGNRNGLYGYNSTNCTLSNLGYCNAYNAFYVTFGNTYTFERCHGLSSVFGINDNTVYSSSHSEYTIKLTDCRLNNNEYGLYSPGNSYEKNYIMDGTLNTFSCNAHSGINIGYMHSVEIKCPIDCQGNWFYGFRIYHSQNLIADTIYASHNMGGSQNSTAYQCYYNWVGIPDDSIWYVDTIYTGSFGLLGWFYRDGNGARIMSGSQLPWGLYADGSRGTINTLNVSTEAKECVGAGYGAHIRINTCNYISYFGSSPSSGSFLWTNGLYGNESVLSINQAYRNNSLYHEGYTQYLLKGALFKSTTANTGTYSLVMDPNVWARQSCPLRQKLGQIPITGASSVTISCSVRSDNSNNNFRLSVGGGTCGLTTQQYSTGFNPNTLNSWQNVSLTINPSSGGFLDLYAESYAINNFVQPGNIYIDSIVIS